MSWFLDWKPNVKPNCCKQNWDVIASILEPSWVVLLCIYQFDIKHWNYQGQLINMGFCFRSYLSSKLSAKSSKVSQDWLGKRYSDINLHILPQNYISKLTHSFK